MNYKYLNQVRFLINILGEIKQISSDFALKGGTAINLFYQNLPRLSIDIDLVYLPIEERDKSLREISGFLSEISNKMDYKFYSIIDSDTKYLKKLIVKSEWGNIKIEPSLIVRGNLETVKNVELCKKAQSSFETNINFQCLSINEVYAGKFVAALDRQHPRDLFDIRIFIEQFVNLKNNTEKFYELVLIYLLQSNRPISELIEPHLLSVEKTYYDQFLGLTNIEISLEELQETRFKLVEIVKHSVFHKYFDFIISFMNIEPNWELLNYYPQTKYLPGIKWKLYNINKMERNKRMKEIKILENIKISD